MRLLVLMLLIPSVCFAGDWTSTDTAWEAAYLGALTVDCLQARDTNPRYIERNPVLGPYPSRGKIDNLCALSAIGHLGMSYVLPSDWRRTWQISTVAIELVIIRHQYEIGLKLSW